ncbi:S8 family serine peptidase [Vogesella sp. LIG4]|uniref:S8 family peptidase n=1 Tax=Vogesella sp. LIG4 TaxID=1192162 RepID=UPI00081FEF58|nr:S8 family serine peptidase [Vogesella sp. LIG4]SCK14163.1 Subtilisin-like serine proteases [Vogesella sp. LIG4]
MANLSACGRVTMLALAVSVACAASQPALAASYAPWLTQIGLNDTVASAANWGYGQVLGVVDTGVSASSPEFASGQVSRTLSSCAALSFSCSNGFQDDNGHGTAVASIAAGYKTMPFTASAGGYTTKAGSLIGVAPLANIVAEKVLNAQGSAYSTDVANGVRKAADAGATVINLSLTFNNDAATVQAINYAAAKGAFIVWAGGNSAANLLGGANTSGLTDVAIKHLLFAGSVNSQSALSSFSNKPGSGALLSSSGARTGYASRWLMAPGESIIAPYILDNNNLYLWSGTSMSTPIVSGSLMLLQNAWPILRTNGTTADLLLLTAKDLGSAGVDSTYGSGLVSLQTAFQPYGALTVTGANGKPVTVSSLSGAMISSGALGNLSTVKSQLSAYTAFDSFTRNFSVNLSGLLTSVTAKATLNPLPSNTFSAPKVMKLADGAELAYASESVALPRIGQDFGFQDSGNQPPLATFGYAMYAGRQGDVMAMGYGAPAAYGFSRALFNDDLMARQALAFEQGAIGNVAQGGYQLSYGSKLGSARVALSYTTNQQTTGSDAANTSNAQYKVGVSLPLGESLRAGLSYGEVNESNGLLGSSYAQNGLLSLGGNHSSVVGASLAYRLDANSGLLLNAELGHTRAAQGSGLLSETSAIVSNAFGISWLRQNLLNTQDQLSLSLTQPLRVASGRVALLTASTDADGRPVYGKSWSSLAPSGREMDLTLAYTTPLHKSGVLQWQAGYQKDAGNSSGNNRGVLGMNWKNSF